MKIETLEHALAEAIARCLTDSNAEALTCREMACEAALKFAAGPRGQTQIAGARKRTPGVGAAAAA